MTPTHLLIPAVMLTASLGATANVAPTQTLAASATTVQAQRAVTPAVMGVRAPADYPVPQRLQNYNDTESSRFAMRCTGIRCGSISGSDNGWDDSDQ